ncbi:hypothetical protein DFH06DRAFT_1322838 [Mycena polygramma]|nr:hypothetical protein DFH06DRAFT_1322838 [Mycena polygramma]
MTDLNNLASAPAPTPSAGAPAAEANNPPPVLTAPSAEHRDRLRSALEDMVSATDALEATSVAVGNTTVSQVYMVLADLAVATAAVTDATAALEAAAAVFLTAPSQPSPATVLPSLFRTTGPWIAGNLFVVVPAEPLAAVPDNNDKWFAITSGKYLGLTKNAALSLAAVVGVSNALSTLFSSQADALDHFNSALAGNAIARPPSPLYRFDSPAKSGYTRHWDEAAANSQGVPGGSVSRIGRKSKARASSKTYIVFHGLIPGVYPTWSAARVQVDGVPGNLHQAYPSDETANAAFAYAEERSWTRVCTRARSPPQTIPVSAPIPSLPQPAPFVDVPNPLHTGDNGPACSGRRWYVVYAGVTPGVYQSSLECGLNVCGLRGARHDSWDDRDVAIAKYQQALSAGRVHVVYPPYYPLPIA